MFDREPMMDSSALSQEKRPILPKRKIEVTITTVVNRIEGEIYIFENRLLDSLNSGSEMFMAVTNAKVYPLDKGPVAFNPDATSTSGENAFLYQREFLVVNKQYIVTISGTVPKLGRPLL